MSIRNKMTNRVTNTVGNKVLKIEDIICRLTLSNLLPRQPKLIVDFSFVHAIQRE